ncbi:RagB/SusD family nutrient uptake outer membrane protein, partial [Bacteroides fragilis]
NKVWDNRLMLTPIPQGAIDLNPLLKDDQNPGY